MFTAVFWVAWVDILAEELVSGPAPKAKVEYIAFTV